MTASGSAWIVTGVLMSALAVTIVLTCRLGRGMGWDVQYAVVGFGIFVISAGVLTTLTLGTRAFYRMAIGVPESARSEAAAQVPKPDLLDFLGELSSGPANYGFAGVIIVVGTAAATLVAAFGGVRLFPPGTHAPRIVFAIPGLIAGGVCYLVLGALVHALMPAQLTLNKRPVANACLGLLLAGGAGAGICWYVATLVR